MATFSLFDHSATPSLTNSDVADSPVTLGVLFTTSSAGHITSVWVYVANTNLSGSAGSALIYHGGGFADPAQPLLSHRSSGPRARTRCFSSGLPQ